jgi:predicted nuclease of restriction endonuclease-like (RecB) superfamily
VRALDERHRHARRSSAEIADSQIPEGSPVPLDSFRDPMLLDMLGLRDTYLERDLEEALVHDMEAFLLEVGRGWAFVARQKRMTFDGMTTTTSTCCSTPARCVG